MQEGYPYHLTPRCHDRRFLQQLNRRKGHEGSVWEHPYHCTIIQNGQHLLNCLRYVDLNMVRCGAVEHPKSWRWCGHDELVDARKRYRLVDIDRLLQSLEFGSHVELVRVYAEGVRDQIERRELTRSPHWTEALAVGSEECVQSVKANYKHRVKFDLQSSPDGTTWMVKEATPSYRADSEPELVL